MVNDRDCENCKHHKEVCKDGIFYHSCESWDCEFEPKEDEEFEPKEDAISRQAVINHICEGKDCYKENCKGVLFNRCPDITWVNELPPFNPQKPICPSAGVDCEDCPAYEPKVLNKWIGAEVLDRIRNEMHATAEKHEDGVYYLRDEWIDEIIDKYAEEGKA